MGEKIINNLGIQRLMMKIILFFLYFIALTIGGISVLSYYIFPEIPLHDLSYALKELDLTLIFTYWGKISLLLLFLAALTAIVLKSDTVGIIILLSCLSFIGYRGYFEAEKSENESFFEKYYTAPELHLKKAPKNVIFISAESMEETYSDEEYWGENLIPYLTKLKKEGTTVSGYHLIPRTETTIRAIGAFFCGIPGVLGSECKDTFLPGATCITDVLKSHGYYNVFIKAGTLEFAKTNMFVRDHHFDEAYGRDELIKEGLISQKSKVISGGMKGIPDSVLFQVSKQKLTELSKLDQPFFLTIFTLNMHTPNGYVEPDCRVSYGKDMRDAVSCSDKTIYDFVKWCQSQDFYKNTIIFIVGDHLIKQQLMTEYPVVKEKLDNYPNREIYNLIIDGTGEIKPRTIRKQFTQMDWLPTVLEGIGFFLPNGKFGMGTSLLDERKTLIEELGENKLINLINSDFSSYKKMFKQENK